MNSPASVAPNLPETIFRAYDIRGVVGDTLNAETAYWIGRAIGSESLAQNEPNVSVGRDGRLSGPELVQQLIQGLHDSGCHVSDVGLVPTPALYYAANVLAGKTGVMLTGSHNPKDYNGFKIVIAGDTLANEQIQALHERIKTNNLTSQKGSITQVDILERYFQQIKNDIVMARKLKVVVDCGNGAAGVIAPQLIEALGCEVISLFAEVDGNFPNHHPDPGKLENLQDLIAKVKETGADLGLAFDGDGDRVLMVDHTGTIVDGDELLYIIARDLHERGRLQGGVVGTLMSNLGLELALAEQGIPFVRANVGDRYVIAELLERNWQIGGENSGHIVCFQHATTGDAIIASLQVILALRRSGVSLAEARLKLRKCPQILINVRFAGSGVDPVSHPSVKEACARVTEQMAGRGRVLLRKSGTEPLVRVMVEGEDETQVRAYAEELAKLVTEVCA
nr:hypothetical protein [Pseudomonas syringae]